MYAHIYAKCIGKRLKRNDIKLITVVTGGRGWTLGRVVVKDDAALMCFV